VEPSRSSDQHRQAGREPLLRQRPYLWSWTLAWIGAVVAAFINGVLHRGYEGALAELRGHQVSSGILLILICALGVAYGATPPASQLVCGGARRAPLGGSDSGFRVFFGHYVNRDSWAKLLADYDLREGRLWLAMSSLSPQHRRR
jgi:hypothetical protein